MNLIRKQEEDAEPRLEHAHDSFIMKIVPTAEKTGA